MKALTNFCVVLRHIESVTLPTARTVMACHGKFLEALILKELKDAERISTNSELHQASQRFPAGCSWPPDLVVLNSGFGS